MIQTYVSYNGSYCKILEKDTRLFSIKHQHLESNQTPKAEKLTKPHPLTNVYIAAQSP